MQDNTVKKKLLFIDRDGTLIVEPPVTFQVDRFDQLEFLPGVIGNLAFIRKRLDYDLIMVTNQDGLGSPEYPLERFQPIHDLMLRVFASEGVTFDAIHIDPTRPEEQAPTRKPGTGMLTAYMDPTQYDLSASYVIGDRITDVLLARNLGCRAILLQSVAEGERMLAEAGLKPADCALIAPDWNAVATYLFAGDRQAEVVRTTAETDIRVHLNLDGTGRADIDTGLGFFDHMLEQIARHSGMDLSIHVKGDLRVDEHHTIEDTALALGEALRRALGDKRGIERYGFCLPMDDCLCRVALDFGGRPWLVWDAQFHREKIGEMPTEMFLHFFKSLSDAAGMNLNISAQGENEHHKIEGIFKALARSLRMAIRRDIHHFELPSSKGVL
jgi:imidazoleglycerol-phosphate dehydratase/histidinol-phosphatase